MHAPDAHQIGHRAVHDVCRKRAALCRPSCITRRGPHRVLVGPAGNAGDGCETHVASQSPIAPLSVAAGVCFRCAGISAGDWQGACCCGVGTGTSASRRRTSYRCCSGLHLPLRGVRMILSGRFGIRLAAPTGRRGTPAQNESVLGCAWRPFTSGGPARKPLLHGKGDESVRGRICDSYRSQTAAGVESATTADGKRAITHGDESQDVGLPIAGRCVHAAKPNRIRPSRSLAQNPPGHGRSLQQRRHLQ
jgi:hypothetical protein